MVKTLCSADRRKNKKRLTCFDNNLILEMKKYWNETYPSCKVPNTIIKPVLVLSHMQNNIPCVNEMCWLNQTFMIRNISRERLASIRKLSFAPFAPETWINNLNEWLSNEDIDNILYQYEKAYNDYKHMKTASIDFNSKYNDVCLNNLLCDFDIMTYVRQKLTKISFVLNTSKRSEPGQHWIAIFININKGTFNFYDSLGKRAPPEVDALYNNIKVQVNNDNIKMKYIENNQVHQYKNGQCGMFCLNFVINMLVSNKFHKFHKTKKNKGYDNIMKNMRGDLFNIL
jgi:hypothetical protein